MLDTQLAYIAAFIDGEGYICIRKCGTGDYQVLISASNVCPRPLKLIRKLFKGSLCYRNRSHEGNRRNIWQYQAVSRTAEVLIKAIYPYLLIKRNQASIALQFLKTKFLINPKQRQNLRNKIQVFNKRGKNGYIFHK